MFNDYNRSICKTLLDTVAYASVHLLIAEELKKRKKELR